MNNNQTFQKEELEKMTTQQLGDLLRKEVTRDDYNEEVIRLLLDMLEQREAEQTAKTDVDVHAAWEEFRTQYAMPAKEIKARSSKVPSRWLVRVAAAAAVICLIVFAAPAAMGAENIFTLIGRWTASIFEFFTPGGANQQQEYEFKTDNPGLQQVYDTVAELGVTEPIVPMWLPDGYELVELKTIEEPDKTQITAKFCDDNQFASIVFNVHTEKTPMQYPKDNAEAEMFEYADVKHYILQNRNQSVAVWVTDMIECCVAADFDKEELYRVIKSIYVGE